MTADESAGELITLYLYSAENQAIVVMRRGNSDGVVGDLADAVTPGRSFLGVPYEVYQQHLARGVITVDRDGAVVD